MKKERIMGILLALCLLFGGVLTPVMTASAAQPDGWALRSGEWYYYQNGSPRTGWQLVNGEWYFLRDNGTMATGWQLANGEWYYLRDNGAMATGWQLVNGAWYYLRDNGTMATGWQLVNGVWYYLRDDGAMVVDQQEIGGKTYFFDASGALRTGWIYCDGYWYYYDAGGVMAEGKEKVGDNYYFFDASGRMLTGWVKCGQQGFYELPDGPSTTTTTVEDGWYDTGTMVVGIRTERDWVFYAEPNGAMHTGWLSTDKGWYYLYQDGHMAKSTYIDRYLIGNDGIWEGTAPANPDHKYYWSLSSDQAAQADAVAKSIADETLSMGFDLDIEKVLYAAYRVAEYVEADTYSYDDYNYYRSPYGVFVAGNYTCAGTTRALGRVLDFLGFTWYHVNEGEYSHQWICVKMDGEYGWVESQYGLGGYGNYNDNLLYYNGK